MDLVTKAHKVNRVTSPKKNGVHTLSSVADSGLPFLLSPSAVPYLWINKECAGPKLHVSKQSATNYRLSSWNGWTLISLHVAAQASMACGLCSYF